MEECKLDRYCRFKFGACRLFGGYEDFCFDLCPKHNENLLPTPQKKKLKKLSERNKRIREKSERVLSFERMSRLIERLRVEKFSLVKYDRGEMITITPLKFYLEKTQKKALLAIEAQNFGILLQ